MKYAFCETVTAASRTPWHIRQLTKAGLKLGGGADTKSLCDRVVCWDINVELSDYHLARCCHKCAVRYNKLQSKKEQL